MTQKTKLLITVPDELLRRFKAACALKGIKHSSLITSFMVKFVQKCPELQINNPLKDKETK